MEIIEFGRWKPSVDDPRKLEYDGQRTAEDVFEQLKFRLDGQGYLPDEYFELRSEWENGREIPRDADLFCTVDYGESEGVYVDVYLKWYDKEQKKSITESFIVGKTLGENGNDLDRMFLTASAITKAVHGDHATHARYMQVGGFVGSPSKPSEVGSMGKGGAREQTQFSPQAETEWSGLCDDADTGGRVVHLSQQEEEVIIQALAEQRERQEEAMGQTEQLLRRMTGSITAYMDMVGQRPLHISDYDKTVLAIRDGELPTFLELYSKVLDAHAGDLLIEAAGRPGAVGRQMTRALLDDVERFPEPAYAAACRKAIDINDPQKVSSLLANAADRVAKLSPTFHGEMAVYAFLDHCHIAREIIKQCTNEQIAAAPSLLLELFAAGPDYEMLSTLVEKGISGGGSAERALHMLTYKGRDSWMAEDLLEKRMWVDVNDYRALHACVENGAVDVAKLLLDGGMDFDQYRQRFPGSGSPDTIQALEEHWAELQAQAQEQGEEQAPAVSGAPIEAQRSGFDGERSPSEMSEPCPQDGVSDMELGATMGGMQFG